MKSFGLIALLCLAVPRVLLAQGVTPGGGQTQFAATFGGTPTAITASASGFALKPGWSVCGTIALTSANNPTLTVNTLAPKQIMFNMASGTPLPVGPAGIVNPTTTCLTYDGAEYILQSPPNTAAAITSLPYTVQPGDWSTCRSVVASSAGTLTMPAVSTLAGGSNCIRVQTKGVTVTVVPAPGDSINGGLPGGSVVIPADTVGTDITSSAPFSLTIPLGPLQLIPWSWAEGLNLAATARYVGHATRALTVSRITCRVSVASGSAGVIHLVTTGSGVAPVPGTNQIDTNGCDQNAASANQVDTGVLGNQIPANSDIWAIAGSSGLLGNGGITIELR